MSLEGTRKLKFIFFIGLLAINLASLLLLSLFNYKLFYIEEEKAFEEKFRSSAVKETELYLENIDLQLRTMVSIPSLYFSSTSDNYYLLYPSQKNILDNTPATRNLLMILSKIQRAYPYLYSLDVYYKNTETIITNFGHIHEVNDEYDVAKFIPWIDKINTDYERIWFIEYGENSYPVHFKTITYVQKINLGLDTGDIYIALHIDPKLFSFPVKNYNISSWFFNHNGEVVYKDLTLDFQNEIVDNLKYDIYYDDVLANYENSDGKYILYSTTLNSDLKYFGFLGYKQLYPGYNEDNQRLTKNFTFQIIFNLICLSLLTLLNYKLYKYYIVGFFSDVVKEKGSLGDALETIGNAYEDLDDKSKSYKNQEMLKLLLLNRASEQQYEDCYNKNKDNYIYSIIIEQIEQDQLIEKTIISNLVDKLVDQNINIQFTSIASPARFVLTVITKKKTVDLIVIEELENINDNLKIDISRVFNLHPNGYQNSFSSAMNVFQYRFIDYEKNILFGNELMVEEKIPYANHGNLLSQLDNIIEVRNREGVIPLLDTLFDDLKSKQYTVQYCKATLDDIVSSIYNIIYRNKLDMWSMFGYDIRHYSKKLINIDYFRNWLNQVIFKVIDALDEEYKKNDNETVKLINKIIDENLNNDISLGMLADSLDMREDALSRLFKSLMGCNYMEFITKKKMDKAIELLREGRAVQDIAAELGYRSPQYFIKIFKATYGVTPSKYRTRNQVDKSKLGKE